MTLNYFLSHCKNEKKLSPKTLKAYESDLTQFQDYLAIKFDLIDLKKVGKEHLKAYLSYLSKFAAKTIKRKVATLKVFYAFLEFEDAIEETPFRKVKTNIRTPKKIPVVLSIEEIKQILTSLYELLKTSTMNTHQYQALLRDIAVVELLFATGIRVSELCFLKKDHFGFDYCSVKILGKGNKERIIPITNPLTRSALKTYFETYQEKIESHDFFFINRLGNRLSEQSVRFLVKRIQVELGIKKHITPHIFRHTFATLLLDANVNIRFIQELLGHSSINITQLYTHVSQKNLSEMLFEKHPRNTISILQ